MKVSSKLAKWAYAFNVFFGRTPYQEYHQAGTAEGGRYGNFGRPTTYPKQINLCNLFWRTVLFTPLLAASGIALVSIVLLFMREYMFYILGAAGVVGSTIGVAMGVIWLAEKFGWSDKFVSFGDRIVGAPIWSTLAKAKGTFCPYWDTEK